MPMAVTSGLYVEGRKTGILQAALKILQPFVESEVRLEGALLSPL